MKKMFSLFASSTVGLLLGVMVVGVVIGAPPAHAATIVSVGNVLASSPSTADVIEVLLTNTGPTSINIDSFTFGIMVSDAHITFTGATINTTTDPYIFSGASLFGPNIDTTSGALHLVASDLRTTSFTTVGSGVTLGLGHVLFDVSAAAAGVIPVTLVANETSLANAAGGVPIDTLTNGSITIPGSAVPEPSTLVLALLALPAFLAVRRRVQG